MNLYALETANFKLDGGTMFGVVPKVIWNKTNPADSNNLVDVAARCLLIQDTNRLILIDTGIGNKQSDTFFGYYSLWGTHCLDTSLAKYGFDRNDITDVFLTHLHFDHCGGCINKNTAKTGFEPAFKNAIYWSNESHWKWAIEPNQREKASFLSENIMPVQESGQLQFVTVPMHDFIEKSELNFSILFVDGHTEKMMIPQVKYKDKTICFMADLIPTAGHVPLAYVPAYDTRPLLTMPEKSKFLTTAAENNYYLFLEHDAHNQVITVQKTEKGVRLKDIFSFEEIL
jgi:glyoxylase-like metal-dependent hydrolase (beta-lactamase superfamily II)